MKYKISILLIIIFGYSAFASSATTNNSAHLLKALAGGSHFALLRHALAPGNGDPERFDLKKCDTQRNLNDVGRIQAKAIGELLRAAGVNQAQVYSSQWCRCLETARLLQIGTVDGLEVLNSFYNARQNEDSQTSDLQKWLSDHSLEQALILVTHQVNITALTGVFPSSGEIVVVKRLAGSELQVIGTVKTGAE